VRARPVEARVPQPVLRVFVRDAPQYPLEQLLRAHTVLEQPIRNQILELCPRRQPQKPVLEVEVQQVVGRAEDVASGLEVRERDAVVYLAEDTCVDGAVGIQLVAQPVESAAGAGRCELLADASLYLGFAGRLLVDIVVSRWASHRVLGFSSCSFAAWFVDSRCGCPGSRVN
jgi:hypothetical protein